MRKLATIKKIDSLFPIEGADAIEAAEIGGWTVVVKKDQFKVNDFCVYIEIDSILPKDYPPFAFLEGKRIKTRRIRGVVSQGICFAISDLPVLENLTLDDIQEAYDQGTDMTDLLGIVKWEPEEEIRAKLGGNPAGKFPQFIFKTDEERFQNLLGSYKNKGLTGIDTYVTVKCDGSSATYWCNKGECGVASRNLQLQYDEDNSFWKMDFEYDICGTLYEHYQDTGKSWAIQGELVGPGIQKNRMKLKELDLFVFNIFDIDKQEYVLFDEARTFIKKHGMRFVPIVHESWPLSLEKDDLLNLVSDVTYDGGILAEGIVIRSKTKLKELANNVMSFKVINPKYLMKHDI